MAHSPQDFRDMVVKRRDSCVSYKDDKPSRDRKDALRFYRGDNLSDYGDSGDGLSTVVSRDTMEAVESMMPSLVRPFVAGEQVVSFEPVGPEDEKPAKQATDYINHVFSTHNNAFRVVHDAMKDGLLYRLGVAKTVMEECEDGQPEKYDDIDVDQLGAMLSEGREIAGDIEQDEETGLFSVTLAPKKVKKYRVHIVAPEEFLYEERLASLEQATFLGHSKQVTLGDLIGMGISDKKAKALKSGRPENDEERDQRFEQEDETEFKDDDLARPVWVDECYVRCDYGKTGTLGWRKVLLGGSQSNILSNEEADGHPYSTWTPIPIAHKLVGMSIHDITRDVQMQKTALQREMLNNLYLTNRPQREVLDGQVNIDDLLNPMVGSNIRVKQMNSIQNISVPFVAGSTFPMIEYLDGVRESRTGVTRYNQGMDSQSLNKTATGMNIIASASQQRQELVARQFAEFLKDVFKKLLGLVMQHGEPGDYIRLRGEWVEVDPTQWKDSYDMTVTVGLGTNNKDQLVGQIMQLMQVDEKIIMLQQGIEGPLLTSANIYEKLKRLVEAMGLKGIDKYYTDPAAQPEGQMAPEQPEEGPPQPDPMQQQAMEAEMANKAQETAIKKAEVVLKSRGIDIEKFKAETERMAAGMPLDMPVEPDIGMQTGMQVDPNMMEPPYDASVM